MADKEKKEEEVKAEEQEVKEEEKEDEGIELEYGQFVNPFHPTMQAISRLCSLYIGIDENFLLMNLNDALVAEQKKFEEIKAKLYLEVYERPIPRMPEEQPDPKKMSKEEKEKKKEQDKRYGKLIGEAQQKTVKIKYPEIQISKEALQEAMSREENKVKAGKDAIFLSPNDIAILRDFVTFI